MRENPCGVVANVLKCDITVSEFELHSLSDNYPLERCEPPYPTNFGLNSTTSFLLQE